MKKQILLVDDDIFLLNSISSYLISYNFSVCAVYNVTSALKELEKRIPDVIITDIMMSNLDGYDFLKSLRSDILFHDIPVIFLTAKGMTSDRIKGYDMGCNAYLIKPFDPNELVAIVNNLLKYSSGIQDTLVLLDKDSKKIQLFLNSLTTKEKTVLELVSRGLKNKEIAESLNVSVRSAEKYVSKLLNKTSTRNRTELAQFINNKSIGFYKGE
nr:hypothetical protein [Calliblepharis sp.]